MYFLKKALIALTIFVTSYNMAFAVVSIPDNGSVTLSGQSFDQNNDKLNYYYQVLDTDGETVVLEREGSSISLTPDDLVSITKLPGFDISNVYKIKLIVKDKFSTVYSELKSFSVFYANNGLLGIVAISSGVDHTCAITVDNTVKCWGDNSVGQLGNGTNTDSINPVDVLGITNAHTIIAGNDYTCTNLYSGEVYCWGKNNNKQLGNNSTKKSNTPVLVQKSGVKFTQISSGNNHVCGVDTDNNAYCWGRNNKGKLGDGTQTTRGVPTDVFGLQGNVAKISAGQQHSCALLTDGSVKCWGNGKTGSLGGGNTSSSNKPVSVIGLDAGAADISTGAYHNCVITKDSKLKCWGKNNNGQLGDGSKTNRTSPVEVTSLSGKVSSIELGYYHSCATLTSGAVSCWGLGTSGELGDGNSTSSSIPVYVNQLNKAYAVSGGKNHSCSLTNDGKTLCWGANNQGQIGDGTKNKTSTPIQVLF